MKSLIALSLMALSFGTFANECLVYGPAGGELLAKLNTTEGIVVVDSLYNSNVSVRPVDKSFSSETIEISKLIKNEHKLVQVLKQKIRALTPKAADKLGSKNNDELVQAIQTACSNAQPITEVRIQFPRVGGSLLSTNDSTIKDIPAAFCELHNFKFAKNFIESRDFYRSVQTLPYSGAWSRAEIGIIYNEITCVN